MLELMRLSVVFGFVACFVFFLGIVVVLCVGNERNSIEYHIAHMSEWITAILMVPAGILLAEHAILAPVAALELTASVLLAACGVGAASFGLWLIWSEVWPSMKS